MAMFLDVFWDVTKEGRKIPKENYLQEGLYQIIDQGQNEIAGYTNDPDGLYEDVPVIIFGDHTRVFKYVDKPLFLGADGVKLLKAKDESLNVKYLYYALQSAYIPDTGYNRHFKWLKEIDIPVTTLNRQDEIVSVLDKIVSLVSLHKQQLAKLDELVKVRFVEMFGNPGINEHGFVTFQGKDLFVFSSGKFLPEERRLKSGYPVYGGNGIGWYTDSTLTEIPTIIIGRVGAQCGNIHLVTEPVWITDNAIYIKKFLNGNFSLRFLSELMKLMNFRQYAEFSGQPKITQKPLNELLYIAPPIEHQMQFDVLLEYVDYFRSLILDGMSKLETLKASLMQEYFR